MAGVEISGVRATVDEVGVAEGQVRARLESALVRIDGPSMAAVLPPEVPVRLERLAEGSLWLRGEFKTVINIPVAAQVKPWVSAAGRLRLAVMSLKAGFLPVPFGLVAGALREGVVKVPPFVRADAEGLEIDLAAAAAPYGVELPPLRSARVSGDSLELEF